MPEDVSSVEPSLNGKAKGDLADRTPGGQLIFVAVVSGITWIAGLIVITVWSIVAYLSFRDVQDGSRAGADFIANGIYYGFPLGALAGLWLGTKAALRLLREPRRGSRLWFGLAGGVIALLIIFAFLLIALLSESPIRLAGLPVIGPILAILGVIAPGAGVAIGKAWYDRRSRI